MYIRNKEGKLVKFNVTKFKDERTLYTNLWKILYGIKLNRMRNSSTNSELIKYILSV